MANKTADNITLEQIAATFEAQQRPKAMRLLNKKITLAMEKVATEKNPNELIQIVTFLKKHPRIHLSECKLDKPTNVLGTRNCMTMKMTFETCEKIRITIGLVYYNPHFTRYINVHTRKSSMNEVERELQRMIEQIENAYVN